MAELTIAVDTAKLSKLQAKFSKYGPYAIKQGLKADENFLNTSDVKRSMYPINQNGSPFAWSSDKQRRFVFATVDLPYSRTFGLADAGKFVVNENTFHIEYTNSMPAWKFIIHPSYQIIGHRLRGWPHIVAFIRKETNKGPIIRLFREAALKAWDEMDSFMFGGGAGL